jgi:hypothetical protein
MAIIWDQKFPLKKLVTDEEIERIIQEAEEAIEIKEEVKKETKSSFKGFGD